MPKLYCHLPPIIQGKEKLEPGDFELTDEQRSAAYASLGLICSKNPDTTKALAAARRLLGAALYLTELIQNAFVVRTDIVREASKEYAYFPVLIASKDGADTNRRLERIIGDLLIGANGPFKTPSKRAKNDKLRTLILIKYDQVQRIRTGRPPPEYCSERLHEAILSLPEISMRCSRPWAKALLGWLQIGREDEGASNELLSQYLSIDPSQETQKRKRIKKARVSKKYSDPNLGEVGATCRDHAKLRLAEKLRDTERTPGDLNEALVDKFEKALTRMLK